MDPKQPTEKPPVQHEAVGRNLEFLVADRYRNGEDMLVKTTATEVDLFLGGQSAGLTIQYPDPPFAMAWIAGLWVPWKWRKRGLARSMMLHAIQRIHARGYDIALAALPYGENAPMQAELVRFYESLGFVTTAEIVMVKRRPAA
jgi:GNAT superfamily N-acetyltransferase